jgi:hypothetical protein
MIQTNSNLGIKNRTGYVLKCGIPANDGKPLFMILEEHYKHEQHMLL